MRSHDTVEDKILMAIFAHPDDEMTVSPMLVNYVDQGVKVYLVICTDGRLGTNEFTDHKAGDGHVPHARQLILELDSLIADK